MLKRRGRRALFLIVALLGAFVVGGYTCTGPLRTPAQAVTTSSGHWTGYWTWTWNGHNWVATWTWVWGPDNGGWMPS